MNRLLSVLLMFHFIDVAVHVGGGFVVILLFVVYPTSDLADVSRTASIVDFLAASARISRIVEAGVLSVVLKWGFCIVLPCSFLLNACVGMWIWQAVPTYIADAVAVANWYFKRVAPSVEATAKALAGKDTSPLAADMASRFLRVPLAMRLVLSVDLMTKLLWANLWRIAALTSTWVFLSLLHPPNIPKPTGPFAVGVEEEDLEGYINKNHHVVPATIFYPIARHTNMESSHRWGGDGTTEILARLFSLPSWFFNEVVTGSSQAVPFAQMASAKSIYPILFLSHDAGLPVASVTSIAQRLSSEGFVVICLDHSLHDTVETKRGGQDGQEPPTKYGVRNQSLVRQKRRRIMLARLWDIDIAYNALRKLHVTHGRGYAGKLDWNFVVAAGIGAGAAAALAVCIRDMTQSMSSGPRFHALCLLNPQMDLFVQAELQPRARTDSFSSFVLTASENESGIGGGTKTESDAVEVRRKLLYLPQHILVLTTRQDTSKRKRWLAKFLSTQWASNLVCCDYLKENLECSTRLRNTVLFTNLLQVRPRQHASTFVEVKRCSRLDITDLSLCAPTILRFLGFSGPRHPLLTIQITGQLLSNFLNHHYRQVVFSLDVDRRNISKSDSSNRWRDPGCITETQVIQRPAPTGPVDLPDLSQLGPKATNFVQVLEILKLHPWKSTVPGDWKAYVLEGLKESDIDARKRLREFSSQFLTDGALQFADMVDVSHLKSQRTLSDREKMQTPTSKLRAINDPMWSIAEL